MNKSIKESGFSEFRSQLVMTVKKQDLLEDEVEKLKQAVEGDAFGYRPVEEESAKLLVEAGLLVQEPAPPIVQNYRPTEKGKEMYELLFGEK